MSSLRTVAVGLANMPTINVPIQSNARWNKLGKSLIKNVVVKYGCVSKPIETIFAPTDEGASVEHMNSSILKVYIYRGLKVIDEYLKKPSTL